MKPIKSRVILADDHPAILEALQTRLSLEPDFEVVATANDCDRAYFHILELTPDLVLLDIEMPGRGAFTVADEVRARLPKTRIVFFTGYLSDVFLDQALRLKAHGYFLKGEPVAQLIAGLRKVVRGEVCFSESVRERLEYDSAEQEHRVKSIGYLSGLTNRQIEVLRHLVRGESVKEVARAMILSERAIESHKYRIMQKLGIHDRVELARYAIREGLTLP